ncbi:MAG: hypothetical protein GY906_07220 [bacterium]|nr:hypothetical protein [bacterium]
MELTKKQKKHFRTLAALAYDREISVLLEALAGGFNQWKSGEISCWDLNELVHKYHNGGARELWKKYTDLDAMMLVGLALADEIVEASEVPVSIRETAASQAELARKIRNV